MAYNRGIDESRYADTRGDLAYNRATDESRYQDTRGDVQYGRDYQANRDAIGDTRYLQETAYDRGRDTVADQRYNQTYADSRGDIQYARETDASRYQDTRSDLDYARQEAQRLEGKGDIESLISSVQDPRAQNLLRTVQAQGGDVKAMYQQMMDNGTIKEDYRSASPGTQAYQAAFDELAAMYPRLKDEFDKEYEARIGAMIRQDYETSRAPLDKAVETRDREAAYERLAAGKPEDGDFDLLPSATAQAIPLGKNNTAKWLAESTTGGWTKIGDKPYKVIRGDYIVTREGEWGKGDRHMDYAVLQDQQGRELYLTPDGKISPLKPVGV